MDALKKAEKAKQGAGDEAAAPSASTSPGQSSGPVTEWPVLSVDPTPSEIESELGFTPPKATSSKAMPPPTPVPQKPVSAISLEPLNFKAAPDATPAAAAAPPEAQPAPQALPPQGATNAAPNASLQAAERRAAKSVFSAKRPAAGEASRAPFLAIVGALLAIGIGGAYYFWSQLQIPASAPPAATRPVGTATGVINAPVAPVPVASAASPNLDSTPAATPQTTSPATPAPAPSGLGQPGATPPAMAPPTAPASTAKTEVAVTSAKTEHKATPTTAPLAPTAATARPPTSSPAQAAATAGQQGRAATEGSRTATAASARGGIPVDSPSNLRITRDRAPVGIDPAVAAGYAALAEGNVEAARDHYSRALAGDATNRDALLGMATIALRGGNSNAAQGLYQRVLEIYPRDAYATAQLSTLRSGSDAAGSESRVKSLLANEPDKAGAAPLHFALGNQMAAQNRWPEAQQAYFNAFAAEPDNPDYCFNLAVSLDQIRQPKLAFEHYARALELAQKRRPGFDLARAKARLDQLAISAK